MGGNVRVKSGTVLTILGPTTTTSTGPGMFKDAPNSVFQATVVGTGAVSATVVIECSLDNVNWCQTALGTITLSGTNSASDGFTTNASWKYIRARISAVSGTSATVNVDTGV